MSGKNEDFLRERENFSPEKINAGTLAELCREKGSRMRIFCVAETGSTNSDVAKMLAGNLPETREPFALVAEKQTAGRGRAGRSWASAATGNIYLSCGFRPQISPSRMANFTLWIGVAVARVLREKFGVPAMVKWPNDIFCSGKKLAGILTEVHLDSARVRGIVLGLGLNVNLDPASLPADVRDIATSMRAELGGNTALNLNAVCAEILCGIERAYEKFVANTYATELATLWQEFDLLHGVRVCAVYGDEEILGIVRGIDAGGRLLLDVGEGRLCAFSAGDIRVRRV